MNISIASTASQSTHCSMQRFTVRMIATIEKTFVNASQSGRFPLTARRIAQSAATPTRIATLQAARSRPERRVRTMSPASVALIFRRQQTRPGNIIAK